MRVLLDGDEIRTQGDSIADALDAGRVAAEAKSRIIIDASLDGTPLTDDQFDNASEQIIAEGSTLQLVTAEPRSFVHVTLSEVAEALDASIPLHSTAADLLMVGKLEEALPALEELLSAWNSLQMAVHHGTALLKIDASSERFAVPHEQEPVILGPAVEELSATLVEVKRCLVDQDWAALADTLAYDLSDRARRWRTLVLALADHVRSTDISPRNVRENEI